jgi:hypothetical protein
MSCAEGCGDATIEVSAPEPAQAQANAIHANAGSTITKSTEPNTATGQYPQVMEVQNSMGKCTGTVIAPYTVLTAAHCNVAGGLDVSWNDIGQPTATGFNNPYFSSPYTPAWVVQLGEYPGMHDQAIFFVPQLSPAFLAANHLNPISVNPNLGYFSEFTVVGVGSTDGLSRDSIAEQFVAANVGSAVYPEDGYLTCDVNTPNFGATDHGDSGGPHLGTVLASWTDGSTYPVATTVMATSVLASCDNAPLSYNPNFTETADQQSTVRLNSLWAMARADDADGDGLPNECDSDPANSTGSVNLCPSPLGAPVGAAAASVPAAQLTCPFGYRPVGIRGLFGTSLNRTALVCDQLQCTPGTGCDTSTNVTTDYIGGNYGSTYLSICPEGERMVGLTGTSDSTAVYSVSAQCLTAAGQVHSLTPVGNTSAGTAFSAQCLGNNFAGFQARSNSLIQTTGLQPICAPPTDAYFVGPGYGQNPMQCPPGNVAVGLGYAIPNAGGDVQMTGLICGEKAVVTSGQAVAPNNLTVLRAAFEMGSWYPAAVEPHSNLHVPPSWTEAMCPVGSALSGVTIGWDTTQAGYAWVSGIQSLQCKDIRSASGATTTVQVNAGNLGGAYSTIAMNMSPLLVDGFITCDAQLECGLMLHGAGPPAAPSSLAATSNTSAGVTLSWAASATPQVTYRVFRSLDGSFNPATSVPVRSDITGLSATDPTPAPSQTNFYYVLASNPDGLSFPSNELSVAAAAIAPPTGLAATAQFDSTNYRDTITLTWNAPAKPAASYAIFRSTTASFTPSAATQVATTTNTTFTDGTDGTPADTLFGGTKYYYYVEVMQSGGFSPPSNEASATAPPFTVAAPTGLVAVASVVSQPGLTLDQITLTWNANANQNTIFDIYRSTTASFTPSPSTLINNIVGNSYVDQGIGQPIPSLYFGQTYYYYVQVEEEGGTALPSNEASANTPGLQVDCGSTAGVAPYLPDQFFTGNTATINHNVTVDVSAVTNPAPKAVYQTAHLGPVTYALPAVWAPGSSHTVRLHFAETWSGAVVGTRQFNVSINGTQVLYHFDILTATNGVHNKANIQAFSEKADSTGAYTIAFTNYKNSALISAIEVE